MVQTAHDSELLDALCDLFDDEADRQEAVLAISIAQGRAARAHDIAALEAKTQALTLLIREAAQQERDRIRLVTAVVAAYGLPWEKQTLSDLIETVPDPWKRRMAEFQERMVATLEQTRRVTRENRRYMRGTLKVVHQALDLLQPESGAPGDYDASGEAPRRPGNPPSFIDRKG